MTVNQPSASSSIPAGLCGVTLVCGETGAGEFAHAVRIGIEPGAVSAWGDGAVASIVAPNGLEGAFDPIQTLRAWRRVLQENGTLVLGPTRGVVGARRSPAAFALSLAQLIGGFECGHAAPPSGAATTPPLVLTRRRIAEVRAPLGVLGPSLAAAANAEPSCRVELLFQTGAVFLQCGETTLARACFDLVLRLEPSSAEGHFGLGMAHGSERRWKDALCELECARRLDPDNAELQRWLDLARAHVGAGPSVVLPAGTPAKWSPSPVVQVAGGAGLRIS